jgi:hypothetical protein
VEVGGAGVLWMGALGVGWVVEEDWEEMEAG